MGNWIKRTSMPTPRHDLQSIAVDGKIYAISGADDLTLDVVEIYAVERDSWSAGPPIPTARGWIGAALLDAKIYVGCGKTIRTPEEKKRSGNDFHFMPRPGSPRPENADLVGSWRQRPPAPGPA